MRRDDASFVELPAARPAAAPTPEGARPAADRGFFAFASTSLRGLSTPFLCLLGYLLLQTTFFDEEWPSLGRFRPRLLLGGAALLVAGTRLLTAARERDAAPAPHRAVTGWLVAFVIGGLLATLWAFEPGIARPVQIEMTTTMLVFFLLLAIVRTRREVVVTILVLAAGAGLYLLRSFTEYLAGKHMFTMGVSRMMGAGLSVSDPNSFAGTLAFSLPLLTWCAVRTRHALLRACVVVYGLLATYCVIQTHSRSGLVLHLLNVLFALALLPSRKVKVALALTLVGLGVWIASSQTDEALDRYASILSERTYTKESSTVGRIEGYKVAWRMFTENPLTGVGPGNWPAYRMRRVDGEKLMPHNLAGQVIATYGLAGLLPFVGYLGAVGLLALRVRRRRAGSADPWDLAVRDLALVVPFTLLLLLVSGLGAHNVDRAAWYLLPALLVVAARATAPGDPPADPAGTPAGTPARVSVPGGARP